MAASNVDAHLEILPESAMEFILSEKEASPKVTMTLRHPDPDSRPVAFKVKTTQPRRYLVRPNQGVIQPGGSENIQVLLVEKDKMSLLQSFQRLGQTALDNSKDKFLVQSVAVDQAKAAQLQDYDQLTALWLSVTSAGSSFAVANKKLSVRHTVDPSFGASSAPSGGVGSSTSALKTDPSDLSPEQLVSELSGLRRKYDELVAFSVNLTAERDILNNTLEQTKRDLHRQIAKSAASDNSNSSSSHQHTAAHKRGSDGSKKGGNSSMFGLLVQLLLFAICILLGAHLQKSGSLGKIPVIDEILLPAVDTVASTIQSMTASSSSVKTTSSSDSHSGEL